MWDAEERSGSDAEWRYAIGPWLGEKKGYFQFVAVSWDRFVITLSPVVHNDAAEVRVQLISIRVRDAFIENRVANRLKSSQPRRWPNQRKSPFSKSTEWSSLEASSSVSGSSSSKIGGQLTLTPIGLKTVNSFLQSRQRQVPPTVPDAAAAPSQGPQIERESKKSQ